MLIQLGDSKKCIWQLRHCQFFLTSPLARDGSGSTITSLRCSLQMTPAWLVDRQLCWPQSLRAQRSMSYSLPPHLTSSIQNFPFPRPNGWYLKEKLFFFYLEEFVEKCTWSDVGVLFQHFWRMLQVKHKLVPTAEGGKSPGKELLIAKHSFTDTAHKKHKSITHRPITPVSQVGSGNQMRRCFCGILHLCVVALFILQKYRDNSSA